MFKMIKFKELLKYLLFLVRLYVFSSFIYLYKTNLSENVLVSLVSISRLLFEHAIFLFILAVCTFTPFLRPMFMVRVKSNDLQEYTQKFILRNSLLYSSSLVIFYVFMELLIIKRITDVSSVLLSFIVLFLFGLCYFSTTVYTYLKSENYELSVCIFLGASLIGKGCIYLADMINGVRFLEISNQLIIIVLVIGSVGILHFINDAIKSKEIL